MKNKSFYIIGFLFSIIAILFILRISKTTNLPNDNNYIGKWPNNLNKHKISGSALNYECQNNQAKDIGCICYDDNDCINHNCVNYPRENYCTPKNGDIFPEFIGLDQFNQKVNLYDFAHQGKYIMIELATTWCSACKSLADWLSNNNMNIKEKRWWKDEYSEIKELVNNNNLYYITILYENNYQDYPDYKTSKEWFDMYSDIKIPILADEKKSLHRWVKPTGIPTTILLNDKMEIVNFSNRGINSSFDKALQLLGSSE